jgi:hypothetical protein
MSKPFSVSHWGSHPDEENDDCFTGEDFDSLEEAIEAFHADPGDSSVKYIELDGLEDSELSKHGISSRYRKNPNYRKTRDDDSDWKRENAMQAGMAFGCDGYNEAMGRD